MHAPMTCSHRTRTSTTHCRLVGTGRFELPTPRTPSECSTRLSHVPTRKEPAASSPQRMGFHQRILPPAAQFRLTAHFLELTVWSPSLAFRLLREGSGRWTARG